MRPGAFTICDHDQVATTVKDTQVGQDDTTSMTAALVGLVGVRLLTAAEVGGELELLVETDADLVGCPGCGAVGRAKDRRPTWVRDLPIGGRAVVLCWWKRVWCCPHPACETRTWTERHEAIAPRAVLTERARQWAFEQVGEHDAAVAQVAAGLGVAWWTVMDQVLDRGTPVIDAPARLSPPDPAVAASAPAPGPASPVSAVGVDETAYLRATSTHPTSFATGIADLTPGRAARLLDVVEGRWAACWPAGWARRTAPGGPGSTPRRWTHSAGMPPRSPRSCPTPCGCSTRSTWSSSAWAAWTTSAAGSSRTSSGTAAGPETRSTASAGCCAAAATGSAEGPRPAGGRADRRRPRRGGHPGLDRRPGTHGPLPGDNPDQARARAETLIGDLRSCPIPEIARLGAPCTPGGPSCARTSTTRR